MQLRMALLTTCKDSHALSAGLALLMFGLLAMQQWPQSPKSLFQQAQPPSMRFLLAIAEEEVPEHHVETPHAEVLHDRGRVDDIIKSSNAEVHNANIRDVGEDHAKKEAAEAYEANAQGTPGDNTKQEHFGKDHGNGKGANGDDMKKKGNKGRERHREKEQGEKTQHADNKQLSKQVKDTRLEDVVEPDELPPHYAFLLGAYLKPVIAMILFGPPRPEHVDTSRLGALKVVAKRCMQLLFLAMAVYQTFLDIKHSKSAFMKANTRWEGVCFIMAVLASSGNVSTSLSMTMLGDIIGNSLAWRASHLGQGVTETCPLPCDLVGFCLSFGEMVQLYEHVGFATCIYILWGLYYFYAVILSLLMFCFPTLIAYCWLTLPAIAVNLVLASILGKLFPSILGCIRGDPGDATLTDFQEAESTEERQKHLEVIGVFADSVFDDYDKIDDMYDEQWKSFRHTGVLARDYYGYFIWICILAPLVASSTPMAARLYTGQGYMPSLTLTFGERHIASYIAFLRTSLVAKFKLLNLLL